MSQQDEGRIDPAETEATRASRGIRDLARLGTEAGEESLHSMGALSKIASHEMETTPSPFVQSDGEIIPDVALPGDGGATHAARESREISKLRYDLIPADFLEFLARIFTYGASKYEDNNWMKGLNASELYACATRHMQKWWAGEDLDEDDGEQKGSGLSHLWHALWNVGVMAYFERHRPDLDDRGDNDPRLVTNITPSDINVAFLIEVQLPADGSSEGFIFAQQGEARDTIEQARAVVQALRDDGYANRLIRVVRTSTRIVEFTDGTTEIDGTMADVVQTVFPGDRAVGV